LRIIAGIAKGRRLKVGTGWEIRPTPAKIREALFNILGSEIRGSYFLDLFAGSGAIGIEALSRGASRVIFVDKFTRAIRLIQHNLSLCGFKQGVDLYHLDVFRALAKMQAEREKFDFIFLDPPYRTDLVARTLETLNRLDIFQPGGKVIAEHPSRESLPAEYDKLMLRGVYRFGDTALSFYDIL
jgi:16S rRNA (guanine(966)-N(2))-methyltransferase RsmD